MSNNRDVRHGINSWFLEIAVQEIPSMAFLISLQFCSVWNFCELFDFNFQSALKRFRLSHRSKRSFILQIDRNRHSVEQYTIRHCLDDEIRRSIPAFRMHVSLSKQISSWQIGAALIDCIPILWKCDAISTRSIVLALDQDIQIPNDSVPSNPAIISMIYWEFSSQKNNRDCSSCEGFSRTFFIQLQACHRSNSVNESSTWQRTLSSMLR
jgi:hypothetical protein